MTTPVLLVTGPVGVGKTTVASAVADELGRRDVPHGVLDVDWLSQAYPSPPGDPFRTGLTYRNLTDVSRNMLAFGAERLVLAYVVEDAAGRAALAACIPGCELTIVRLTAEPAAIVARLEGRESPESLAWYLARAPELTAIMARNGVGDHVLPTDGRNPVELAIEVLRLAGW